ncbi:hypothetical protein [uncultured Duncaniella sp.]|uniref:hypothetical protein n=1 Tax=uncultured Duncaniella sp. TaxID=2768039 RepID=UPI00265F9A93|nr:hypothetical protein [uncultured Duncaniella sp.]
MYRLTEVGCATLTPYLRPYKLRLVPAVRDWMRRRLFGNEGAEAGGKISEA